MSALGATGLSCLCIGAVLGALLMWRFYSRYAEYEALASYYTGFARGRRQGYRDVNAKIRVIGVNDERPEELGRTAQGTDGLGGDGSSDEPHVA